MYFENYTGPEFHATNDFFKNWNNVPRSKNIPSSTPLKSLYARAREVKMISLATHPSKNLLPIIGGVWNNQCHRLRNFLCERMVDAESPVSKTLLDIWQLKLRVLCDQCDNSYVDGTVPLWWEHTHVKLIGLLFIIHYFKYLRSLERYYLNSSL